MGEERKVYKHLWESPKERGQLEVHGVDGRLVLEVNLRGLAEGCRVDPVGSE
jgi:hypothetical protein